MNKENILEAWTMVEHLSEGDININDKNLRLFKFAENKDFYNYCKDLIKDACKYKKFNRARAGIAVYINVFKFNDVIDILRKNYKLKPTQEEITDKNKFTISVYFDCELVLKKEMTFLTVSGAIKENGVVPDNKEFHEYEKYIKTEMEQQFGGTQDDPEKFNKAMVKLLNKFHGTVENSYFSFVGNLEANATNLHSFFIEDIKNAYSTDCGLLNEYLFGFKGKRFDLDSNKNSAKFAPDLFYNILQPKCYPLGRFPSDTRYALSFMQQIAVNLSVGVDKRNIRSVNGPPGTGKTTLLKDIFAQLITEQARNIYNLKNRTIAGTSETVYYKNASIGELPQNIAEYGIVVASSNNGAVKNIVDELPKIEKIDCDLVLDLKEADYFWELSNQSLGEEYNSETKKYYLTAEPKAVEYWGLFSLEGGRTDNMKKIITSLKHIQAFLSSDDYEPDSQAYEDFKNQYIKVRQLKEKAQNFCNLYKLKQEKSNELLQKRKEFEDLKKNIAVLKQNCEKENNDYLNKINVIEKELRLLYLQQQANTALKIYYIEIRSDMVKKMPGFFGRLFGKKPDPGWENVNNELQKIQLNEKEINEKISKLEADKILLYNQSQNCKNNINQLEDRFSTAVSYIEKLQKDISDIDKNLSDCSPLNMNADYETLQLSNPWFDENYRAEQSILFILALRLRKQFLYENRKNLKAAINIWEHKKNFDIEQLSRLMPAAWNWINFAIPVISSTFASFSNMCRHLGAGTIGHLFIDEAGQAVPQAAVGAIMRSRHVMAVGDPSQIKPVLTLDSNILSMLSEHFKVSDKYLSDSASVQTLADQAGQFGFYRSQDRSESSWIGIPLWVHRRCKYPMFDISNEISYQGLMVQGKKEFGKTGFFNISGTANDKFVQEQADFLKKKLSKMIKNDPDIIDKSKPDKIYIITPFRNVAYKLSQELKNIGFTRYDDSGKPTNIGTIHTFQGKEAPIVFLVLGADTKSKGSAMWAVSEANMLNVAATRAKDEFYIVGDSKLYCSVGSDHFNTAYSIIRRYGKEHPELTDNEVHDF